MHWDFRFVSGLVAGLVVVVVAWRAKSLSASGALAAATIGLTAAASGRNWVGLLLLYFVSSSILSRIGRSKKLQRTAGTIEKGGARDAWQVLSNGLLFGVMAAANLLTGSQELFLLLATGALAGSAADTWATEIGTLMGGTPRSILSWRRLPVGTSGGVSISGTVASVAGAMFVSFAGMLAGLKGYFWVVIAAGVAGSLADSIAGALIQRRQWCDACGVGTEMKIHVCGAPTRMIGGVSFVQNDAVNFLATIIGAVVAFAIPWWTWTLSR